MEQRTQHWFEQRKLRITGSRVGAILGLSPWQSQRDVLRAIVREYHGAESEFAGNPATDHGVQNEQRAMLAFMRETGLHVEKCGFFHYGDRMGASPDGIASDGSVVEVKVPFGLRNGGTFKALADQPHYAAQLQLEMLSAGAQHGYFAQYIAPKGDPLAEGYVPEQISIERVEADPSWLDKNLAAIDAFYGLLMAELDNPEHLEALRVVVDAPDAAAILAEIDAVRDRQKADAAREKELLAELVAMAEGKNAEVHGRKLTLVKRSGSISYHKVVEDMLPNCGDLERYRGKPSESWRLT